MHMYWYLHNMQFNRHTAINFIIIYYENNNNNIFIHGKFIKVS